MSDNFEELSSFNGSFRPEGRKFALKLDALTDGAYDFRISAADLVRTPETKELLLRLNLDVLSGPVKMVEHVYFFRTEKNVSFLGSDLMTLGFDSDKWTLENKRPFDLELKRAILKLPGIMFRGKKVTNDSNGKKYANLEIQCRIQGTPMPAAQTTPPVKQTAAAATDDLPPWA